MIMRANPTPGSRVATDCNSLVAQARHCSSFQLAHMSREDHAWSIELAMAYKAKGRQELITQLRQHGEFRHVSVSE